MVVVLLTCDSDPSGFKTHGTDDVDGFGEDYTPAARDLKTAWTDSPDDLAPGALQPWQNAENIAAAATGMSFLEMREAVLLTSLLLQNGGSLIAASSLISTCEMFRA